MQTLLFKDRHPMLHAFLNHPWELTGLAFILMVLLEIGTFCHLIRLKLINNFGNTSCSIRASDRPHRR